MLKLTEKCIVIIATFTILFAGILPCAGAVELNATGSITLSLYSGSENDKPIPGATFSVCKIAGVRTASDGSLQYYYEDTFKDCGVKIAIEDMSAIAVHYAAYAVQHSVPLKTAGAQEGSNTVEFNNLTMGLYLVIQTGSINGYYPCSPFVISVPFKAENGTDWVYDINTTPKVQVLPSQSENIKTRLKVQKTWNTNGEKTPDSVTVTLLRDFEPYESIVLNAENNWTYQWNALSSSHSWSAVESDVPAGFSASYVTSGKTVIITNTSASYDGSTESEETTTGQNTPPLIHTGQLSWPVPVMATAGLILFAIGWMLTVNKGKKNDA